MEMDDVGPACQYVSMTNIIFRYLQLESNFTSDNASVANHNGVDAGDYEYDAAGEPAAQTLSPSSGSGSSVTGSSVFGAEYNIGKARNHIDRGLVTPPISSMSGLPTWFRLVIPIICAVGIAGNLLSIAVLTRRRLLSTMQRLERSVTHGLTALAVSDLLFCVAVLPQGGLFDVDDDDDEGVSWTSSSSPLILVYRVYGVAVVNLLLMQSTWLVTMMAACRYLVVVYPLHARHQLTGRATIASISAVVVVSLIVTAPHFVGTAVNRCWTIDWQTGRHRWRYEIVPTSLHESATFYVRWVWPICSTFLPLSFLGAFNVRLVRELNAARRTTSSVSRGLGRAVIPMTMISIKSSSSGYSLNQQQQGRADDFASSSPLRLPIKSDDGLTVTRSTSASRKGEVFQKLVFIGLQKSDLTAMIAIATAISNRAYNKDESYAVVGSHYEGLIVESRNRKWLNTNVYANDYRSLYDTLCSLNQVCMTCNGPSGIIYVTQTASNGHSIPIGHVIADVACPYRIQYRCESYILRVTLTLVVIILMNLGLVTPSEILKYVQPDSNDHSISIGHVIADVANAMQALNFAVNFFLYCVLNPHFRSTVTRMFECHSYLNCCHSQSFDIDGRGRAASVRSGSSTVAAGRGRPCRRVRPPSETRLSAAEVELVMDDTSCERHHATSSQAVHFQV